jgi:hypothetical protein
MELELSFIPAASCSWTGSFLQNSTDIESSAARRFRDNHSELVRDCRSQLRAGFNL